MATELSHQALLLSAILAASACRNVEVVSVAGAGADASTTASSASTTVSTGAVIISMDDFCATACAHPADAGCFSTPTCADYCEMYAAAWSTSARSAFSHCVATNPLCYLSVPGCMLGALYPPTISKTVTVHGAGFDAYDGRTAHVWHDPGAPPAFGGQGTIANGALEFEWHEAFAMDDTGGPLLLAYIDVDGNGACEAGNDVTISVSPSWNGDFDNPSFDAHVTPAAPSAPFVCRYLP